ncbi:MAG: TolC family protein [Chthoniobacterales bacterium]
MSHHRSKNFLILMLLSVTAVQAETLPELTREALRNNPELRILEQGVAAAKGGVTTARTYSNPELTLAPGVKRVREAGNSKSEFHGIFELSQLFKFPGKRALEIAIAGRDVRSREIALEALRFQLAAQVRRTFYESLAAKRALEVRGEQVESAKAFVASAQKRVESGFAGDFETIKSQAELIAARKAQREAEGRLATGWVALNTLLGRSPAAALEISGTLENVAPRGSLPDFTALALARNPALLAQNAEAEKAGLNLRLTRFGNRPDFAVGPSVEYTDTEQIYGLSATIALPFWDRKKGELETATAEQRRVLAEIEKLRLEIRGEVTKAAQNLQLAKEQLALYSPDFLDRLKSFVRQAEQGYAQSATTLIIYLDAKRTYFDTLTDYYEALGNVAQGRAELESAIGVPLELNP